MKQASVMAGCSMMTALGVVLLLVGGVLELGMYACPMLAGLCILLVGDQYGKKQQWMTWIATSLLGFLLVPNVEENLMYFGVFGLYPILYPYLQNVPAGIRMLVKVCYFNGVVIFLEWLLMMVLIPEMGEETQWFFLLAMLVMGNIVFWCYDRLLPRMEITLRKRFGRMLPR